MQGREKKDLNRELNVSKKLPSRQAFQKFSYVQGPPPSVDALAKSTILSHLSPRSNPVTAPPVSIESPVSSEKAHPPTPPDSSSLAPGRVIKWKGSLVDCLRKSEDNLVEITRSELSLGLKVQEVQNEMRLLRLQVDERMNELRSILAEAVDTSAARNAESVSLYQSTLEDRQKQVNELDSRCTKLSSVVAQLDQTLLSAMGIDPTSITVRDKSYTDFSALSERSRKAQRSTQNLARAVAELANLESSEHHGDGSNPVVSDFFSQQQSPTSVLSPSHPRTTSDSGKLQSVTDTRSAITLLHQRTRQLASKHMSPSPRASISPDKSRRTTTASSQSLRTMIDELGPEIDKKMASKSRNNMTPSHLQAEYEQAFAALNSPRHSMSSPRAAFSRTPGSRDRGHFSASPSRQPTTPLSKVSASHEGTLTTTIKTTPPSHNAIPTSPRGRSNKPAAVESPKLSPSSAAPDVATSTPPKQLNFEDKSAPLQSQPSANQQEPPTVESSAQNAVLPSTSTPAVTSSDEPSTELPPPPPTQPQEQEKSTSVPTPPENSTTPQPEVATADLQNSTEISPSGDSTAENQTCAVKTESEQQQKVSSPSAPVEVAPEPTQIENASAQPTSTTDTVSENESAPTQLESTTTDLLAPEAQTDSSVPEKTQDITTATAQHEEVVSQPVSTAESHKEEEQVVATPTDEPHDAPSQPTESTPEQPAPEVSSEKVEAGIESQTIVEAPTAPAEQPKENTEQPEVSLAPTETVVDKISTEIAEASKDEGKQEPSVEAAVPEKAADEPPTTPAKENAQPEPTETAKNIEAPAPETLDPKAQARAALQQRLAAKKAARSGGAEAPDTPTQTPETPCEEAPKPQEPPVSEKPEPAVPTSASPTPRVSVTEALRARRASKSARAAGDNAPTGPTDAVSASPLPPVETASTPEPDSVSKDEKSKRDEIKARLAERKKSAKKK